MPLHPIVVTDLMRPGVSFHADPPPQVVVRQPHPLYAGPSLVAFPKPVFPVLPPFYYPPHKVQAVMVMNLPRREPSFSLVIRIQKKFVFFRVTSSTKTVFMNFQGQWTSPPQDDTIAAKAVQDIFNKSTISRDTNLTLTKVPTKNSSVYWDPHNSSAYTQLYLYEDDGGSLPEDTPDVLILDHTDMKKSLLIAQQAQMIADHVSTRP